MKRYVRRLNRIIRKRKSFSREEKWEIYKSDIPPGLQYAICRYCGCVVTFEEAVICHEWAWSKFGPNAKWNLFCGHADCNLRASDKFDPWVMLSLRTWLWIVLSILTIFAYFLIIQ